MADGLGTGDNTRAAVITRGLAELSRLGLAMGGDLITFAGLAGILWAAQAGVVTPTMGFTPLLKAFVAAMNRKARALGMTQTRYSSAFGDALDPEVATAALVGERRVVVAVAQHHGDALTGHADQFRVFIARGVDNQAVYVLGQQRSDKALLLLRTVIAIHKNGRITLAVQIIAHAQHNGR